MLAHLDSGCEKCRRKVDVMSRLAAVTAASRMEAPAALTEAATALCQPLSRPRRRTSSFSLRVAFDSLRQPALVGVRGADRRRQILYEGRGYSVDLSLSRESQRGRQRAARVVLVGQVAARRASETPLPPLPVLLMVGNRVASRAFTNAWGEFHLEYDPGQRVRLRIPVKEGRIEIPLDQVSPAGGP